MPTKWCDSADTRREQIESGLDLTFNVVFKPYYKKQIIELPHNQILEVGAGTGHLAKEISQLNCNYTAIEPSAGMFRVAGEVLENTKVNLINCSSFTLALAVKYDIALSHLVAHVVDDISEFLSAITTHIEVGGYLIFSIPHPCFYNDYKKFFGEEYCYMKSMSKNVSFFISLDKKNPIFDVPYHHRPVSAYINALHETGFILETFDEIFPDDEIQAKYDKIWDSPRYCVFICRKI